MRPRIKTMAPGKAPAKSHHEKLIDDGSVSAQRSVTIKEAPGTADQSMVNASQIVDSLP